MERIAKSLARAWPCVASAILMLLAYPPFGGWPLVFVALVPWLISLRGLDGRAAWRSGYCLGFVYGLGQLFWLAQFVSKWVGGLALGSVPWLLACVLYALYFAWTGVLIQRAWARGWLWAIPLAWAGIEAFRSYIPVFAFPWGMLATPLADAPALIQLARFGTVYGISALLLAINLAVALAWTSAMRKEGTPLSRPERRGVGGMAVVGGIGFLGSLLLWRMPIDGVATRFAAIQPGVDIAFGDQRTRSMDIARNVQTLLDETVPNRPALTVLPEGMVDVPEMPPQPLFSLPNDAPLLFGGRRVASGNTAYQTAFAYENGRWQYADKTRLVIFGEFVPGRDIFPFLAESFRLPAGDLVAGTDGIKALDAGGLRSGPVICFEALFPDIAYRQAMNGARVLAVMSVDDWFMDGVAPQQLRAASVWRAVETGLPVVRAASIGHTFAVDPQGRVVGEIPVKDPGALQVGLPVPPRPPTVPWLPVVPGLATIVAFGLTFLPKKRV
ncbi:MAG: apolipoprotein N-acyltransferase [Fimbriimonas sp.]